MSPNKGKRPSQDMEKPAKRINNTSEQANDNAEQQQQQLKAESGPSAQDNNKRKLAMNSQEELARMEEKLFLLDPEISQIEDTLKEQFKLIEQLRQLPLFPENGPAVADYRVWASKWITVCQKVENIKQIFESIKTNKLFGKKGYIEENEADFRDNYKNVDDGDQHRGSAHDVLQPAKEGDQGKAAIVDNMADAGEDQDGEVAAVDQPREINEDQNAAINDGEPVEEGEPGRPRQLDIDAEDKLAPSPTISTVSFTSMLTLHKIRAKVFSQLSLLDQRPLRLVCKDWDKTTLQVMRDMKTVSIGIGNVLDPEVTTDYIVWNTQDLLALLERHENVHDFLISNAEMERDLLSDEDFASRITSLEKLERLELRGLDFSSKSFDILGKVPQLSSLKLDSCKLTDDNLGCLGKNIREITIEGLEEASFTPLFQAMRALHTNGIPLQKFELFGSDVTPTILSLAQFMLENFASLRALTIYGSRIEDTPAVYKPLKQMLAVNIEELDLTGISWSSESHFHQFFETLLAQPLPHLQALFYMDTNIPLKDNILRQFWDMCPKLDKMDVEHRCDDLQNLAKLYLARERSFSHYDYD